MQTQKQVFKKIFIVVAIIHIILPGLVMFGSVLTGLFNKMGWYVWLQNMVVPFESRLVAVLIRPIGIIAKITPAETFSIVLEKPGGYIPITLEWNCLGWQSLVLLILTFTTGLRGHHTLVSKGETVLIGVLGTFLINIFRMALIASLVYYVNDFAVAIVHDYLAALVALIWMLFFWWFSYSFVLEPKETVVHEANSKV